MYKGRIIGVVVGFLLLNIIGAIIGYFIGANYDKKRIMMNNYGRQGGGNYSSNNYGNQAEELYNEKMYDFIFSMLGFIAKSSGRVDESEITKAKTVMERLEFNNYERSSAIASFNRGKSSSYNFTSEIDFARNNGLLNGQNPYQMFRIFAFMAFNGNDIDSHHHNLLMQIANRMNLSQTSIDSVYSEMKGSSSSYSHSSSNNSSYNNDRDSERESYSSSSSSSSSYEKYCEACFLFDVDPNSDFEEIRRAYKKAMFKYHPDKIASKDLPAETKKLYEKRAKEIQDAFEVVKSYHNKS